MWALPKGWALKRVEVGAQESDDHVVDVRPWATLDGVKVIVTDSFSTVTSRIDDNAAAATVLLCPQDEARWLGSPHNVRLQRADQNDQVKFESVPPGDYLAIALRTVQRSQIARSVRGSRPN